MPYTRGELPGCCTESDFNTFSQENGPQGDPEPLGSSSPSPVEALEVPGTARPLWLPCAGQLLGDGRPHGLGHQGRAGAGAAPQSGTFFQPREIGTVFSVSGA